MSLTNLIAGSDLRALIKDESDNFISFAGLRTKNLHLSAHVIDATDLQSPGGWRELLPGGGIKSASVTGEGVFVDTDANHLARSVFFTQTLRDYRFLLPEFGTVEGAFLMSELTYRGMVDGLAQYSITLLSAGEPVFSPIL